MGLFKRAGWHSGLRYRQTCEQCKTVITYMDDSLDFRPWFPDGFVYCPTCKKPLRHNENYAIDEQTKQAEVSLGKATENETVAACVNCGSPFREGDKFCSQCGTKREA